MAADVARVEAGRERTGDGVFERVLGLLRKEDAADIFSHGFKGAALCIRQDGLSAGFRLQRHDAVVLFAGEDERAAAAIQLQDLRIGTPPEDFHGGTRQPAQFFRASADADHLERAVEAAVDADGQIDAFVGNEGRNNQVVGACAAGRHGVRRIERTRLRRAAHDVHRGIDDVGFASVEIADAFGDVLTDGDKAVDPFGGLAVPGAECGQHGFDDDAFERIGAEVLLVEGPRIPHRGKADAEVPRAFGFAETLGDAVRGGEEQAAIRHAGGAGRPRKNGEELPVVADNAGQAVERRKDDGMRGDGFAHEGGVAQERGDGGIGPGAAEILEHAFAAAHAGEPVVTQRHTSAAGSL